MSQFVHFLHLSSTRSGEKKERQRGNGTPAVQTELLCVPGVYLTEPIIALFVEMKAQFSEAHYNKSNSDNSGSRVAAVAVAGQSRWL